MKPKILVVEDNPRYVDFMREVLLSLGVEDFLLASNVEDAKAIFASARPELAIVDIMLPSGYEGIGLIRAMRNADSRMHIIAVSALKSSDDRMLGIEAGADDYIPKNMPLGELKARLKNHIVRAPADASAGVLSWRTTTIRLADDNVKVEAYGKVFAMQFGNMEAAALRFLLSRKGKAFPAKELQSALWPAKIETDGKSAEQCVRRIRAKYAAACAECPIKTLDGGGYVVPET